MRLAAEYTLISVGLGLNGKEDIFNYDLNEVVQDFQKVISSLLIGLVASYINQGVGLHVEVISQNIPEKRTCV